MNHFKLALTATALCLSLSLGGGCYGAGRTPPPPVPAPTAWTEKIGQQCLVLFSNKAGSTNAVSGLLKFADDNWVVVSDVQQTDVVDGKSVSVLREYRFPRESVVYVSFTRARSDNR